MRLLALACLVAAAGCTQPTPGPNLPTGPQAQEMAMRATWRAFQDAVRDADRDALVALWRADAPVPPGGRSGATGEELAAVILRAIEVEPELREAILAASADELAADGMVREFMFVQSSVDPDDGTVYESGVVIYFVVDPETARASLLDTLLAG